MQKTLPEWLEKVPADERLRARKTYLLRFAALRATPRGTMRELSIMIGLSPNTLGTMAGQNCHITPRVTLAIEALVGRDLLPRELLNPDVYPTTE